MTERDIELRREIELIFAKECAAGLRDVANRILSVDGLENRMEYAKAHAQTYASAFTYVLDHFIASSREQEAPPEAEGPSSNA